jgi:hypothetical protein
MSFKAIPLESWDHIHKHAKPDWLYRGQTKDWSLQTSLERLFKDMNLSPGKGREFEENLLRSFRRAYHHYSAHVPAANDELEWLSLMQHHGAPTRLLDFTYSIYVAAYFAVERATDDCVVWAINRKWTFDESIRLMKQARKKGADRLKKPPDETYGKAFAECFLRDRPVQCVCAQNPFRLNERLRVQSGVFLVPGSIEAPFEDNLSAMDGHDDSTNVFKLIIPKRLRRSALCRLFEMNISCTSLFPGLDGYARTLGLPSGVAA